jgi:hypothetical protein
MRKWSRDHTTNTWVMPPIVEVVRLRKEGGWGDMPETRFGRDAVGRCWHNGRSTSLRILTEKALAQWKVNDRLAAAPPARDANSAPRTSPAATPPTAAGPIPAIVQEALDKVAQPADGVKELECVNTARAIAAELGSTITDIEIAQIVYEIGLRGQRSHSEGIWPAYIAAGMPAATRMHIERCNRDAKKAEEAAENGARCEFLTALDRLADGARPFNEFDVRQAYAMLNWSRERVDADVERRRKDWPEVEAQQLETQGKTVERIRAAYPQKAKEWERLFREQQAYYCKRGVRKNGKDLLRLHLRGGRARPVTGAKRNQILTTQSHPRQVLDVFYPLPPLLRRWPVPHAS